MFFLMCLLVYFRNIIKEELELVYMEMIYYWFICNFKNIDFFGFIDIFIKIFIFEYGKYYLCINLVKIIKSKLDFVK